MLRPLFDLGRTLATPGALSLASRAGVSIPALLERHAVGDWGDIGVGDRLANELALPGGARLLSAFQTDAGRLWIITEADRSSTTVLLPDEY
ncbi:hypothetical protein [Rubrivirga sp. SAORIC476]|uniref:hypothetical protein n=1 Tax=Rubrivirga sp. SAORIC476 TaxID=1961794 RepID=UPI000BA9686C|nr:hypothetical protein [Rubrivirga sp. SAORIC476]